MSISVEGAVAGLAVVRDEQLRSEARSTRAEALLSAILATPSEASKPRRQRRRLVAVTVTLGLTVLLAGAALGVARHVTSFFAGWHDPNPPIPSASDVILASGKAGVHWRFVATTSDRGLCLALVVPRLDSGSGGCGPTDVRGDPWGQHATHWIGAFGDGDGISKGLTRHFAWGPLASDVASVDLAMTNGTVLHANVVTPPAELGVLLKFYWAAWPCPVQPAGHGLEECVEDAGPVLRMAVVRDADGRVLERRVPIWNGNPTGDPNGPPSPDK